MKQEYYNRLASDKIKTEVNKEFNLIDTLKIEQELLVEKIAKTRDKGDYKGETFEMQFPMKYPPEVQRDIQFDRYDKGLNPPWKLIRGLRKIHHMIDRKGKKYIE